MYSYLRKLAYELASGRCPHGAVLVVDSVTASIAEAWFRNYEPQDITSCLVQLAFFAIAPVVTAVIRLPSPWIDGPIHLGLFLWTLLTYIVFYRVTSSHPLAKYPGPVICKVSKIWTAWLSYKGKLHLYYDKLHKKYGPIVRIGPNELSVTDARLIPNILGQQGMPKGQLWEGRMFIAKKLKKPNYGLISVRDYNIHAQLRKPWNRAFGPTALQDYEESLIARGTELIERLEGICRDSEKEIGHIDISKYISYWSFDFMGDMAFGESFGLLREGDKYGHLRTMEAANEIPAVAQMIPWAMSFFHSIPFWNEALKTFAKFSVQQAQKRASKVTEKKDLFYYLAASMDVDDDKPPIPVIISNVVLAIVAGSDTTSSVLSCTIYRLLQNPEYLERLQKELDTAFPPTEHAAIQIDKLANLELLNAIVNEVLRLHPPVATGLQRAPAKGSGGKLIGDMFIPEGTGVTVPPYVLHRDRRYFSPNPDKFWPERWYTQNDRIILDRSAFIPFSYGPANCAGRSLALMELRFITAMLVHNFDFWFEDGYDPSRWEEDLIDWFVTIKGKLPVKIMKRAV